MQHGHDTLAWSAEIMAHARQKVEYYERSIRCLERLTPDDLQGDSLDDDLSVAAEDMLREGMNALLDDDLDDDEFIERFDELKDGVIASEHRSLEEARRLLTLAMQRRVAPLDWLVQRVQAQGYHQETRPEFSSICPLCNDTYTLKTLVISAREDQKPWSMPICVSCDVVFVNEDFLSFVTCALSSESERTANDRRTRQR